LDRRKLKSADKRGEKNHPDIKNTGRRKKKEFGM
jgi:hypothetical protein